MSSPSSIVRRLIGLLAIFLSLIGAGKSRAVVTGLSGHGDSLTDEYAPYGYGYARSWYQLLGDERGIGQGALGSWGEPRGDGREFNWARFGATTGNQRAAFEANQTIIGAQVTSGGVSHSVVFVGNNDFAPWRSDYASLYGGADPTPFVDAAVADVTRIVDGLRAGGSRVVVASVFDFGILPWTVANGSFTDPSARGLVREALRRYRDRLALLAATRDLPFVDLFAFGEAVFGRSDQVPEPSRILRVGNVPIAVLAAGTGGSNGFVADGIHHHTVLQGLMANLFVDAINRGFAESLVPFDEAELLAHAGLAYGGANTLPFVPSAFVTVVPEPGLSIGLIVGALGLMCARRSCMRTTRAI